MSRRLSSAEPQDAGSASGSGGGLDPDELRELEQAWTGAQLPATARRLMLGAVEAFAATGYHATTTRDIAARAGLSPAGVYVHFASKEALLYQISLIGHQRALGVVREAGARIADPAERLARVIAAFTAWHARHHTTARVINYELNALSPQHQAEISALRREIDAEVRRTLSEGVRAGLFDVPDPAATALALLSLTIDVARWYRTGGARTPDQLGELYADLALRMAGGLGHGHAAGSFAARERTGTGPHDPVGTAPAEPRDPPGTTD